MEILSEADRLLAANAHDPQLHFIRGMALGEIGRYSEAAEEFRWILATDPSLQRPRLELARMLVHLKRYDSAKYHFEQVLAGGPPAQVRQNILNMLATIRERTPTLSTSFEIVSDTNPSQQTSAEEVEIRGLRYKVNNDGRANQSAGVKLTLDGRIPLDDSLWFLKGYGEIQEFAERRNNFQYLRTTIGHNTPFPNATISVEAGAHVATYGNSLLYQGAIAEVSHYRQWRNDLGIKVGIITQQLDYKDYSHLSGWQNGLSLQAVYAPSPTQRWEINCGLLGNSAREAPYSYLQANLGGRYSQEWRMGWLTAIGLYVNNSNYKAEDPIFLEKRHDLDRRIELELSNSRIRYHELTPRLQIGLTERKSNIDFYSYHRFYFRIGMTATF